MTRAATDDPRWMASVAAAGVPVELFKTDLDDREFAVLGAAILDAASESRLSDQDLYALLVRFWVPRLPPIDWPPGAAEVARRCAAALAGREPCELGMLGLPTTRSLGKARDTIIAELRLTPGDLLAVLAEHWQDVAGREMPDDGRRTLLAFAEHVLLAPIVGACALLWSILEPTTLVTGTPKPPGWDEWSPVARDDWRTIVSAELVRLGRPARKALEDADTAADVLASARAAVLAAQGDLAVVGASIVRTSGWPGDAAIVTPLVERALRHALDRRDEVSPETDSDQLVDAIQGLLMPAEHTLLGWARDPSLGTLIDPVGGAQTGAEMLIEAARWLTWSLARAAVEVVSAPLRDG